MFNTKKVSLLAGYLKPAPLLANIAALCMGMWLSGCQQATQQYFTVEGTLTGAAGNQIMLAQLPFNRPERIVLDSATLDSSGYYKLRTQQTPEGMYQLFLRNGPGLLLINDVPATRINAQAGQIENYIVEGSPASESLKQLYQQFSQLQAAYKKNQARADSLTNMAKVPDSLRMASQQEAARSQKALYAYLEHFVLTQKSATATWYALGLANTLVPTQDWQALLDSSLAHHPSHAGLRLMQVSAAGANAAQTQGQQWLGKPLPNITLPDTAGRPISLSSFKGKWLLVDFWASWCPPCRQQNPALVAANRAMKGKPFTMVGISLDKDRQAWMQAIASDSLNWTHLSDLQFWESRAVGVYNIQALPFNMLIDPTGVVRQVGIADTVLLPALKQLVK